MRIHPLAALGCLLLLPAALALPRRAIAQANNGSPRLVLKDPTPRDPDPQLLFATKQPTPEVRARLAAYNQKRFQLIGTASLRLQALALSLEQSLQNHTGSAPLTPEAQVADSIQGIATNIHNALSTTPLPPLKPARDHRSSAPAPDRPAPDRPALEADASRLLALTRDLGADVEHSSPDVVSVGVLTRSSQIRDLAFALHQRLLQP